MPLCHTISIQSFKQSDICERGMNSYAWQPVRLVCDMNIFSRNWGDDDKRIFISLVRYAVQELRFVSYRECSSYLLCPLCSTGMRLRNWCLKLRYSLIRWYPYNWTKGWTNGYFQFVISWLSRIGSSACQVFHLMLFSISLATIGALSAYAFLCGNWYVTHTDRACSG